MSLRLAAPKEVGEFIGTLPEATSESGVTDGGTLVAKTTALDDGALGRMRF